MTRASATIRSPYAIARHVPEALYTAAALLAVVVAVMWIGERIRQPMPILLVVAGIGLELVPAIPTIELDSEFVLLGLLPPLIYVSAFTMSWQAFRAHLTPILLLAIGCVIATTIAVTVAGHWLIGLPVGYALCFRLGWGIEGLWMGLALGLILVGSVLLAVWAQKSRAATVPVKGL